MRFLLLSAVWAVGCSDTTAAATSEDTGATLESGAPDTTSKDETTPDSTTSDVGADSTAGDAGPDGTADVAGSDAISDLGSDVPDAGPLGVPFGPFALFVTSTTFRYGPKPFTLTHNAMQSSYIVAYLDGAKANGVHLVLAMTGGSHDGYITSGKFDRSTWNAKMDTFNTTAIKAAVAARVADGTILAASVMDEPDHVSWGGVMTGDEVDSMSKYVKGIFPTLPTATVVQLDWKPTHVYSSLDFLIRQFSYDLLPTQGPNKPDLYRDAAIKQAKAQKVGVFFSMNILDGGARVTGCPVPATGGKGTYGLNCRMTPAEVEKAADQLTTYGACGLLMWESDATYFGDAGQVTAFNKAAATVATRPRSCGK